ncbi:MAG: Gfo/Idh/MocA family oxidoreductase, partial [Planctomycetes bacterium]|nr:Gfo/Idh/MocA family oxidoreductase [Planctomycetota bacterium]
MNLTPEEIAVGKQNYANAAMAVNRRDFMKASIATGAVATFGMGAMYFGYEEVKDPVRVGVIGTGDEGGVLMGALNPNYVQVVAICDIRPSSIHRAFHGDWASPSALAARKGLQAVYGWSTEDEARKHVKVYEDYYDLLKNSDVEGVIIALPLHLHAKVAVDALRAGKHVLTEKLMAHNVAQCKVMSRVADETGLHLATGHQRHYSVLYDNAVRMIRSGLIGQIHHIRAQWHRGNLPGRDSWTPPLPGGEVPEGSKTPIDEIADDIKRFEKAVKDPKRSPAELRELEMKLAQWRQWDRDQNVKAKNYGYEDRTLSNGRDRPALEELIRWRIWERTGGGLMAELGSHQLDAASIFVSAMREDGKKSHPLSVYATGGRHLFPLDRDAADHVYCVFEFPAPGYEEGFDVGYHDEVHNYPPGGPAGGVPAYEQDPNKRIVVTYSTINGNGYGGYGEAVLGTKGTIVLEREQDVLLFAKDSTSTNISVKSEGDDAT